MIDEVQAPACFNDVTFLTIDLRSQMTIPNLTLNAMSSDLTVARSLLLWPHFPSS